MGILTESGEVRKIETRAVTPFFDCIGAEDSYEHAARIADSAWIRGHVPEDAPYLETFHNLVVAVAQQSAESGYSHKVQPLSLKNSLVFARALLANKGIDDHQELRLGSVLGAGRDLWERMTYRERQLLPPFGNQLSRDDEIIEEPTDQALEYLNVDAVLGGGLMRILSTAALGGYFWGRGEERPLVEKCELMGDPNSQGKAYIWILPGTARGVRPKPIKDTVFKRSLIEAPAERARELHIKAVFDEILAHA